jgi:hypothetical protein
VYHSRDRIIAASRPLQTYTESANLNIASIFIILTEINNEAHYVAKNNKKAKNKATPPAKKPLQKQAKTAPPIYIRYTLLLSTTKKKTELINVISVP